MSRKEIIISYNSGEYRQYKSYESIRVDGSDPQYFKIVCSNPHREIFVNKGATKYIDINDVIN